MEKAGKIASGSLAPASKIVSLFALAATAGAPHRVPHLLLLPLIPPPSERRRLSADHDVISFLNDIMQLSKYVKYPLLKQKDHGELFFSRFRHLFEKLRKTTPNNNNKKRTPHIGGRGGGEGHPPLQSKPAPSKGSQYLT
jgi:hypothetical protein